MIYQTAMQLIDRFVEEEHNGNVSQAARALGMNAPAFTRWYKRERTPNGEDLGRILDQLGARLLEPHEEDAREVCFVNARMANTPDFPVPLTAEDYLAVPLVSEAGAGPGVLPSNEQESWFLVYRNEPSIRSRSNLIAVRIASGSTSMEPLLHPDDIVLVDRSDRDVTSRPGAIWLVMEPDGSAKVKRVKLDMNRARRETSITFYSENVAQYPPEVFSLEADYEGDLERAVVGRVVWAWSDLSRK